ncbi:MAG: LytR C-terminal domain-containing protein [Actinomycetota bacterium]|nr:LytR C-terminal domain-containing protein [Actinomycetota bacterium]
MSDPTEPGRVTGSHERVSRTTTRGADSGSPVGSPLAIVLTVVAVAAGFLVFRSISDSDSAGGLPGGTVSGVTIPGGGTAAPIVPGQVTTPTPTVAGAPTRTGADVVVGNASAASGVAADMTQQLSDLGYTMGTATDQADGQENLETSIVYYVPGGSAEAVAQSLANDMGGLTVEPMPSTLPVASLGENGTVLLMLGNDYAGEDVPGPAPATPSIPATPTSEPT